MKDKKNVNQILRYAPILAATLAVTLLLLPQVTSAEEYACPGFSKKSASYCLDEDCAYVAPLAPRQGVRKHAFWTCCYQNNVLVEGPINYSCNVYNESSNSYPYGCCTIASSSAPPCPAASCQPTWFPQ